MEMSGPNPGNLTSAISAGLKKVTAAFIIGKSCTGVWDDGVALTNATRTTAITNAQNKGVQVVLSFGGQSGADLARTCSNLTSLTAAYQSAITRFKVTRIDFDIEGTRSTRPRRRPRSPAASPPSARWRRTTPHWWCP